MKKRVVEGILGFIFIGFCGTAFGGDFPLGYPFGGWVEISEKGGNYEEGFKLDSYLEQGVDWFQITKWKFNTFVGLRGILSDQEQDYWNNKVGPWVGIKVTRLFESKSGNYAFVGIGVRWEGYVYYSGHAPVHNENSAVGFIQFSFGGDWGKKKEE